jgi:hypothetical protein
MMILYLILNKILHQQVKSAPQRVIAKKVKVKRKLLAAKRV